MDFLQERINDSKRKQQIREDLQFLRTSYPDRTLYEDFLDSQDVNELTPASVEVTSDDVPKRFCLCLAITTGDPDRELDLDKQLDEIMNKANVSSIIRKLNVWLQSTRFIGDNPEIKVMLYTLRSCVDSVLNHKVPIGSLGKFGYVNPLTPETFEETFRKCADENLKIIPDKNSRFNVTGNYLSIFINFNPRRVTYKTLEREMANLEDIVEEAGMRFQELAPVVNLSISYVDSNQKEDSSNIIYKSEDPRFACMITALTRKRDIWKFGQAMFSDGSDICWDNEDNQKNLNMDTVYRHHQTVTFWTECLIRTMKESDVFTWTLDGMSESNNFEKEATITVTIENISERRKNTVRSLKDEFLKALNRLSWKAKTQMRHLYTDEIGLNVWFVYKGSGKDNDRLPSGGAFDGNWEWDVNIHYSIVDDSNECRQFRNKEKSSDPVNKDPYYIRRTQIETCRKYNPTAMIERENEFKRKKFEKKFRKNVN